jgi:hypothetical protein
VVKGKKMDPFLKPPEKKYSLEDMLAELSEAGVGHLLLNGRS